MFQCFVATKLVTTLHHSCNYFSFEYSFQMCLDCLYRLLSNIIMIPTLDRHRDRNSALIHVSVGKLMQLMLKYPKQKNFFYNSVYRQYYEDGCVWWQHSYITVTIYRASSDNLTNFTKKKKLYNRNSFWLVKCWW